jgi:hypothetical protein
MSADIASGDTAGSMPSLSSGVERLEIYGFVFDYLSGTKLELSPKSTRERGDVAVKSSRESVVFVTWGPLERIPKKADPTEGHLDYNLERIALRTRGRLTPLDRRVRTVNGHGAVYNEARLDRPGRFLSRNKGSQNLIRSLHVHCEVSGRYFVIYCVLEHGDNPQLSSSAKVVMDSFRCHLS